MADPETKSIDQASIEMIEKAASDGVNTVFDRADTMKPCPIGAVGSCCKNCGMGPCRVPLPKERKKPRRRNRRGEASVGLRRRPLLPVISSGW